MQHDIRVSYQRIHFCSLCYRETLGVNCDFRKPRSPVLYCAVNRWLDRPWNPCASKLVKDSDRILGLLRVPFESKESHTQCNYVRSHSGRPSQGLLPFNFRRGIPPWACRLLQKLLPILGIDISRVSLVAGCVLLRFKWRRTVGCGTSRTIFSMLEALVLVGGYIQVWTGRHVRVGLAICIALIENFRLISFNLNSIFESINYLMIYFRLNVSSDHLGPKNWNVELFKSFRYANLRKYSNICGTLNAT